MNFFKTKGIFNKIKMRFLIYIMLIAAGIIFIFAISYHSGETLKNNAQIISTLGRQRMLTQSISKNASRISVIKNALISDNPVQSNITLNNKLITIVDEVKQDTFLFETVYANLKNGFVVNETTGKRMTVKITTNTQSLLSAYDESWPIIKTAIATVNSEPSSSKAFKESLIIINENMASVLNTAILIVDTFERDMIQEYEVMRNLILILLFTTIAISLFAMLQLYNDFFKALNIFYSGFEKLGLSRNLTDDKVTISGEVSFMIDSFRETLEIAEKINSSDSFVDTLNDIYKSFSGILPYTYIGIALLKDEKPAKLVASYGISTEKHKGLAESILGNETSLSETSLEQIMLTKEPRIINDFDEYFNHRPINAYSRKILDFGIRSSITLPLEANGVPIGFIFFSSDKKNVYERRHIEFLKIISNSIALSFQKNIFIDELVYTSILALAKLSEARDEDTGDHLIRISNYAELLAKSLRENPKFSQEITNAFIVDLVKFSPMHDIGKVGIPDNILLKPGKLTKEEFEVMKTHTIYGANVLREAEQNINKRGRSLFKVGIEIAQNHHEKYDGSGYPSGISGDKIPLSARIVAVVDVFDALMSKRPYKEPFSFEETMRIIEEGKGKHFDPDIVDAFKTVAYQLIQCDYF